MSYSGLRREYVADLDYTPMSETNVAWIASQHNESDDRIKPAVTWESLIDEWRGQPKSDVSRANDLTRNWI